ncbi:MAG: hydrogenase maturation nickel metallochaperone HypA [Lachnospiraceae bacterium]|nr:hydrogenase maturation nickel metallochaperone HypA [Lachnospiraceae bacterium]
MHEMSLVRNIVDIVVDEAEAAGADEISAVHVVVGEGHDIIEDLFESLFCFLARGTVAEHAKVILHHVPYMMQCNQCGTTFHLDVRKQETWSCPACKAYKDYKLISGMEFYISKIEAPRRAASV